MVVKGNTPVNFVIKNIFIIVDIKSILNQNMNLTTKKKKCGLVVKNVDTAPLTIGKLCATRSLIYVIAPTNVPYATKG